MNIQRERWIIVREDEYVLCGISPNCEFRHAKALRGAAIKTYSTRGKAVVSFERSGLGTIDGIMYEVVKVKESYEEVWS